VTAGVVVYWVRENIGVRCAVVNTRCSRLETTEKVGARNGIGSSQCLWTEMVASGVGSCQRQKSECTAIQSW
jgi:hypothetical protein